MFSVLNLMILRLDVDSVDDFADLGYAGANPADHSRAKRGICFPRTSPPSPQHHHQKRVTVRGSFSWPQGCHRDAEGFERQFFLAAGVLP